MEQDAIEIRRHFAEQVEDLEQQIRDLTFYVNTKHKLDASPYREELEGSTLVTTVTDTTNTKSSTSKKRGQAGNKGNKKR